MAKKKSETAPATEAKKEAPKKPAAKKPAAAKHTASSSDMPSINTSAAASAAAALVGNRINTLGGGSNSARPESAAFKAMKQNLTSHSAGVANLLPQSAGSKKSNTPFEKSKQVGHNQTFGADVNRAGVPRRTGGG